MLKQKCRIQRRGEKEDVTRREGKETEQTKDVMWSWPQHELGYEASTEMRKPPKLEGPHSGAQLQLRVTTGFQGLSPDMTGRSGQS